MSKSNSFFPTTFTESNKDETTEEAAHGQVASWIRAGNTNYDFPAASELAIPWKTVGFHQSLKPN
jgi:hypothetical protein